jgi:lambda family phage portal protein
MTRLRRGLASFFSVPTRVPPGASRQARMYSAARGSRLSPGLGSGGNSSADAELASSLTRLRSASRQMVRDAGYAKRAKVIVVNNVVGSGIGLQAQVKGDQGDLRKSVNDEIEQEWRDWCDAASCHTGGALHFADLERLAIGQVFEAGEVFLRLRFAAFGDSRVPLAIEIVEPERLADEYAAPGPVAAGATVRMGVEQDDFGRALAYWIRRGHPGDVRDRQRADLYERVPAEQVIHLRIVERWPQTRGEPWMHAAVRKLDDVNEYTASELSAARAASMYFGTIETNDPDNPLGTTTGTGEAAKPEMHIEPLAIEQLGAGEKFSFHAPNRPNPALDPFIRYMLREVAAATGPSYESLSRDYSQSNYSSSRLALLDDRDLWRVLQSWFVRSLRQRVHRIWLRQAVLARAVESIGLEEYFKRPGKFEAARFKTRGWQWVDPGKEQDAFAAAVRNGFTTVGDVISQTAGGMDLEDVLEARAQELELMRRHGLVFDTDPGKEAKATAPPPPDDESPDSPQTARPARVVSFGRQ